MNRRSFIRSLGLCLFAPAIVGKAVRSSRVASSYTATYHFRGGASASCVPHDDDRDGPMRGFRLIPDHPDYDSVDRWRIANGHHPYRPHYESVLSVP